MLATGVVGIVLEVLLVRRLYRRDHLSQVLATFAVILIADDLVKMIWGPAPIMLAAPAALAGPVELLPGFFYPAYRLLIIAVGLAIAVGLYLLVARTRTGMLVRAGSSNREMAAVMGVRVDRLFALIFVLGAMLAAVAGALLGPAARGRDRHGREHPDPRAGRHRHRRHRLDPRRVRRRGAGRRRRHRPAAPSCPACSASSSARRPPRSSGPALAAIAIYVLMAAVLFFRPQGLFPARA